MTDHIATTKDFLGAVEYDTYGDNDRKVALAQVHATLALAEEQRTANIIAYIGQVSASGALEGNPVAMAWAGDTLSSVRERLEMEG